MSLLPIILPDHLILHPNKIRPRRLANGRIQKLDRLENLVGYELLRVMNGKKVGYTLDYTIASNRNINAYVPVTRKIRNFTPNERNNIEDILSLAEANSMYYIPAEGPGLAIYFFEENTNLGMLLAFYLTRVYGKYITLVPTGNGTPAKIGSLQHRVLLNNRTRVSDYIISRLQGYELDDIEANIYCYKNGQNIVELRRLNRANFQYIQQAGNALINDMQQSEAFTKFVQKYPPRLLTIPPINASS